MPPRQEDIENLHGSEGVLKIASGKVDELNVVVKFVLALEADQADRDAAGRSGSIAIIANHVEDVGVNVIRATGIKENVAPIRNLGKHVREGRPIEKTDLVSEFHM